MSEKVEKDYQELLKKREELKKHKITLEEDMVELDKKKKETLDKCFLAVNESFGKIFRDMLPNSFAKL